MPWFYKRLSKVGWNFSRNDHRGETRSSLDIFLQYRIALTWIYPAVKHAAYRPGDPSTQQEVKKCDQPVPHQPIEDYCGKQKKLTKHRSASQTHLLEQISSRTGNVNQNFLDDSNDVCSEKNSTKMCLITAVKNDFTRYLSEKKLHHYGMKNLPRSSSMKNIHSSSHFYQFVSLD